MPLTEGAPVSLFALLVLAPDFGGLSVQAAKSAFPDLADLLPHPVGGRVEGCLPGWRAKEPNNPTAAPTTSSTVSAAI